MSQVDIATGSKMRRRMSAAKASTETFLKAFEWTWTNAILFSMALTFFLLISTSVIPSFWMYYAEQKLGWAGPTDIEAFLKAPLSQEGLLQLRDAITMGLTTVPIIILLVGASIAQNWRRKLRGGGGDSRPSGGYR